ncbi:hypothetical protein [Sphingomonas sp. MMS24-J13]|uniref:hypothetical protein n=1 Tax=Sphingomonas sp. MMS24-J13 TaxID=3238686 RepID=UPI00384B6773
MSPREQLVAYLATLVALVAVFTIAVVGFGVWPANLGKVEAFGLGTITGGLIGILRIPSARSPVASTNSGDVNVTGGSEAK